MADEKENPEVPEPDSDEATEAEVTADGSTADAASADEASVTAEEIELETAADERELTVEDILNAANAEVEDPTDEHLADLKRVTAEYANYRRRTEANREIEKERAIGTTVAVLLPVLDDLDRAEKHGDLEGESPFATIAAKLRGSVERLGLAKFGAVGDPFDPQVHEAIFQQPSPDVEADTVADVVETGYTLGGTLLRAAKVVVKTPA
ncbi:molecular chaperone GrpE [Agromyces terreus]|uniref:Protein GrpE n=1 Tax=Agromyces terreus TaxID=424795 RepID=A0A9X2GWQ6_9MICO|nr:nucleotide exchange factor GrpE [Agromyces terreus]MCP2370470.1 molecular chaperone GrpE [Agromyces terreus]